MRWPTAEELALWRHVVRTVTPLRPAEPPAAVPQPPPVPEPERSAAGSAAARPAPVSAPPRATSRLDPRGPVDLDRRTWLRLVRGQLPVEARLDLHGLTQAEAHDAVRGFLERSQQRGLRCVLVITGRGLGSGGTLRQMTPRWLDEAPNRSRVIAYTSAQRRHGGDGALYVLLRRRSAGS